MLALISCTKARAVEEIGGSMLTSCAKATAVEDVGCPYIKIDKPLILKEI